MASRPQPTTGTSPSPPPSSLLSPSAFFAHPAPVFLAAVLLRAGMLLYGLWQDAHSPVKYTDIDYLVFTDAARSAFGPAPTGTGTGSPYDRETYRYTPLLAWLLYPTTRPGAAWFSSGKAVFAAADLAAGWLVVRILCMVPSPSPSPSPRWRGGMAPARARRFAAIWLLNPMVAAISTRGSSEGLLGVLVTALLWAVLARRVGLAGALLGAAVHFKIYPFIYAPAVVWWMDEDRMGDAGARPGPGPPGEEEGEEQKEKTMMRQATWAGAALAFVTPARIRLAVVSLATFMGLNVVMYMLYGDPFVVHTFLHHVTRIDHRHNFSPYNILLYLTSARPAEAALRIESLAFVPQLLLSTLLIPLVLAKKDLATSMLAQTFAFVTFNKVCTSQYFLWYMVFLPLYLPDSTFFKNKTLGFAALGLWVVSQGLWLQQGFELEFLGNSTFVPGLWLSSLAFFLVNCWVLGIIINDGAR